ncbi:hypothetical protein GF378_03410 [Candidatus Pacearchaeota archaeon]|nr:hypothetical protein [Candidatus Pacearchaeota archaeon]
MEKGILLYGNFRNPEFNNVIRYLMRRDQEGEINLNHKATGSIFEEDDKSFSFTNPEFNSGIFSALKEIDIPFSYIAVHSLRDKQSSQEIAKETCKAFPNLKYKIFEF